MSNTNAIITVATLLAGIIFVLVTPTKSTGVDTSASERHVFLQAAPGDRLVQMFDSMAEDANIISQFPDGTRCAKLSGPTQTSMGGITMSFYRLICDGNTGYVNAQWVDD